MSNELAKRNAVIPRKTPYLATCGSDAGDHAARQWQDDKKSQYDGASKAARNIVKDLEKRVASGTLRDFVHVTPCEDQSDDHDKSKAGIEISAPHNRARYSSFGVFHFLRYEIVSIVCQYAGFSSWC